MLGFDEFVPETPCEACHPTCAKCSGAADTECKLCYDDKDSTYASDYTKEVPPYRKLSADGNEKKCIPSDGYFENGQKIPNKCDITC